MRVLLLNPPFERHFIRSARWAAKSISGSNWYPIWLAYCTGLLESRGHTAKLLDALIEGLSPEETVEKLRAFRPELLVVYVSTPTLASDVAIAAKVKEVTGTKVILVGPWCKVDPEGALRSSAAVDAVAIGEFDFSVLEIADKKPIPDVKGICFLDDDGRLVVNPAREAISSEELDRFPFVTDVYRRHVPIKKYVQAPELYPFVDLFTGRGCAWGKCAFCLWPFTMTHHAPYRKRSVSNVIEELKFIKEELPYVKEVYIQDDTLNEERALELSAAILSSGLKITWACYARVDLSPAALAEMRRAGCRNLHVGFESSNPNILRTINKGITPEMSESFARTASRLGFLIHADFIVGLPGETSKTIRDTIAWAKKLPVHSYQFTILKPYPNTPVYRWLENHGAFENGRLKYADISHEELEIWTRKAVVACNLNPRYIMRMLTKPRECLRLAKAARFVIGSSLLKRSKNLVRTTAS